MSSNEPAQVRLDRLIDGQGAELAAIGRETLRAVTVAMPTANRIADDSDGLLRVHFTPGMDLTCAVLTVTFHAFWISVDFHQGDRIIDLDELLRGTSGRMRHYVVQGPGDVADFEVRMLLDEAAQKADPPLNPENRAKLFFVDELAARKLR